MNKDRLIARITGTALELSNTPGFSIYQKEYINEHTVNVGYFYIKGGNYCSDYFSEIEDAIIHVSKYSTGETTIKYVDPEYI